MENNHIKLASFFYNQQNIPLTKNKVQNLVKEGCLKVIQINNEAYFNSHEAMKIVKKEKELAKNYLSTESFLKIVCRTSVTNFYRKSLIEILSKCNQVHNIKNIRYRNTLFFNKYDVKTFLDSVYTKDDVFKKININIYIYEKIVISEHIKIIRISKNTDYIPKSELNKLARLSRNFSAKERKVKWIKGTSIIKSNMLSSLVQKNEALYNLCLKNSINHFKSHNKILYVDYHSLSSFYRKYLILSNDYYTLTDIRKLLGMANTSLTILRPTFIPNLFEMCRELDIKYITTGDEVYGDNTYFKKNHIDDFLTNYISNKNVVSQYNITYTQLNFLISYHNINQISLHSILRFYMKENIIDMFNKKDTWLYLGKTDNYYSKKQTLELLNVSNSELTTIRKEHELPFYNFQNTTYYEKKDVNKLLNIKKYTSEDYVSSSLVSETLGEHYFKHFNHRKYPTGIERYVDFNVDSPILLLFLKSEYENFLKLKQHQELIDSISYNDPVSDFYELLEINNFVFGKKSLITQQYWFEYCTERILYTNKSKETVPYFVNVLVKCTKLLSEFTLNSELHLKSSNEINLGLLNSKVPITHRNIIRSFIKNSYYRLIQDKIKSSFEIKKLKNPLNTDSTLNQDMNIYDYTTFKEVYSYANNLVHKDLAIDDGLHMINTSVSELSNDYAYSWLYILLHLNNAWRHRDLCNIKMINISFLSINTLEDFSNRDLTNDEVNKIINLLITKEYTVSKTLAINNFFISDDIKEAIANAYVICHLINQYLYPTLDNIINFNNKQNNFLHTHNKSFFRKFPKDFIFKNRKMNRTLLTVMYSLLKKDKHSGAAIKIAQRLRSHKSEESTHLYIKIPDKDINELSINLFNRGMFGYIPKLLNEIIYGDTKDITEETDNIQKLKGKFKDIYNIEATAGFLNSVLIQKESIIQLFIKEGSNKAFDTLNRLQKGFLPGKDQNFQCIVSEQGCLNTGLDCKNCVYSVPNFYATANIVSSVANKLKQFEHNFYNTSFDVEKIKEVNLLFMELDILDDAINKFGEDVVLEFFEGNKQGYLELLDLLNDVDSDKPIHEYATYTPKGVE